MRHRLAATLLALALFGANALATMACEAYCATIAETQGAAHHEHGLNSPPSQTAEHVRGQHSTPHCRERINSTRGAYMGAPSCKNFAPFGVLQKGLRTLSSSDCASQPDLSRSTTYASQAPTSSGGSQNFRSPLEVGSFQPVITSLRI